MKVRTACCFGGTSEARSSRGGGGGASCAKYARFCLHSPLQRSATVLLLARGRQLLCRTGNMASGVRRASGPAPLRRAAENSANSSCRRHVSDTGKGFRACDSCALTRCVLDSDIWLWTWSDLSRFHQLSPESNRQDGGGTEKRLRLNSRVYPARLLVSRFRQFTKKTGRSAVVIHYKART